MRYSTDRNLAAQDAEPSLNRYTIVTGSYRHPLLAADGPFATAFKLLMGAAVLTAIPAVSEIFFH
jgi:hypothetical protein